MKTLRKNLDTVFTMKQISDQKIATVEIREKALTDWIAILWMVSEEVGDALVTGLHNKKCRVLHSREDVVAEIRSSIELRLSRATLVTLAMFLLQSYRDGYSSVDHIDFECIFGDTKGYLTVKVNNASLPRSAKEAWDLLTP